MTTRATTRVLAALAEAGKAITTRQIAEASGVDRVQVSKSCDSLRRRGYAERIRPGVYEATGEGRNFIAAGRAIKDGPCGPHTGQRRPKRTLRQVAWRAMRMAGKFTVPDLLSVARRGGEKNADRNIQKYLQELEAAGYVRRLRWREAGTRPGSNGFQRWQLINDTGPEAPVHSPTHGHVFDPNTGEKIGINKRANDEISKTKRPG